MIGPVQVLVVGLDRPTFSGEVLGELTRLQDAGIVRLVDLLLVSRAEDGTLDTVTSEHIPAELGALAAAVLGAPGEAETPPAPEADEGPTWSLADAIPLGRTAAVALIEHTWAVPLRDAIARNGGRALDETWLASGDLERLDDLLTSRGG